MPSPLSTRERLLAASVVILCLAALLLPALPQDQAYHHFADARTLFGIPRALDTLSNLAFVIAGLWGLNAMRGRRLVFFSPALELGALVFFAGFVLTGLGSAYYHRAPDDLGLALDRFGMVVVFAGTLGMAAAQRVSERAGLWLLAIALVLGPLSLFAWLASGSVTPYAVMQFGGIALLLSLLFQPARGPGPNWAALVGAYALAKLCEAADAQIFELSGHLVSGHTLKHLSAALAALAVTQALRLPATHEVRASVPSPNAGE
ncbi:MAG TPA: hypothetical protein PK177_21925 [Burkholderiaceae bacterium]|nr:hypothetical protein [Burkholderiaceae bacterium]